ncbi:Maltose O-acetyltransferase [Pedobacter sp. Bi27]|uniref:sugar O-acetyltransferase n=1 Tax=unclassified Pedobacter TaxID=2628915 RepID=UPI001E1394C9|nr:MULTISPECIES: sugar O-acetyltransferase [unclassified Pedobacter]CAH0149440.1 Maltose O-acetyltransferase [Pedobacter sp. Bi126]CAH0149882.1 Maltose O-acetyltransferase [Pedobacter sp. Bi27]CAH0208858.1 Maltose O-acetyltransferase [Pedobacter sp. Bi36]
MSDANHIPSFLPSQKDIFERLLASETILPTDPQIGRLREEAFAVKELLIQMNNSSNPEEISEILSRILNKEIQDVTVFTPIYINYGKHINIGKNVFINFDCTFLALGGITIEDDVLIGPKVSLITENHPLNPQERNGLIGKPIHIKKNAWIGASATILPGVTIGENAVIAAGAVVSKDVPDNTVVGGIPAKFIKTIQP